MLKLAGLCKCTRGQHGSMDFEVLEPHIRMIFVSIFCLFPMLVSFRFISASIWEAILIRFGLHFRALRGQQIINM